MIVTHAFNFEKIHEYIRTLSHNIEQINSLSKRFERYEKASTLHIKNILEDKKIAEKKMSEKKFDRIINGISYIEVQKSQNDELAIVVNKLKNWKDEKQKQIEIINNEARELGKKKTNKKLKDEEITKFKEKLFTFAVSLKKEAKDVFLFVSQIRIKQNCELVEKCTESMQALKDLKRNFDPSQSKVSSPGKGSTSKSPDKQLKNQSKTKMEQTQSRIQQKPKPKMEQAQQKIEQKSKQKSKQKQKIQQTKPNERKNSISKDKDK